MRDNFRLFWIAFKRLYRSILGFEEGTDREASIEGIKKDIGFRGHTAWILIFSILICSIGLNVNSAAVVIGAMLISPLMGPILGVGLSIGIHDFDTLTRSLKNLGIAVGISILTATIYFFLTPLNAEQPELLARTKPTILDVLVALFGGFAGIIAGSRKEKTNVIPGVAIATALMPPLCTVGYGIATFKPEYFLGAFYLFLINSIFISLSTYIVVRYLRFPVKTFIDSQRQKKYRRVVYACLIVIVAPSIFIFNSVIQEARFGVKVDQFVQERCELEGSDLLSYKSVYNDTLSRIHLYYMGETVDSNLQRSMERELANYGLRGTGWFNMTKNTQIIIHQEANENIDLEERLSELNTNLRINLLEDLFEKNEERIREKDEQIEALQSRLNRINKRDSIPYLQIQKEMEFHFPEIEKFSFAQAIEMVKVEDSSYMDTIPIFIVDWKRKFSLNQRRKKVQQLEEWLGIRMVNDRIRVIEY